MRFLSWRWPELERGSERSQHTLELATMTPSERHDTIESRARLLLAREREVYELRHTRARAEDWLRAVHALAPAQLDAGLSELMDRVAALLAGSLSFEIAAALEYDDQGRVVASACDPLEIPEPCVLEETVLTALQHEPTGSCEAEAAHATSPLAERLELVKYRWASHDSARRTRFVFLAGFSQRTSQFHQLTKTDQDHFGIFASHAAALLNNSLLLSRVRQERRDLEAANALLDGSLRRLSKTQQELMESTRLVALASRQAGMAEIATGILHNVGNVLNSIGVCGEMALTETVGLPLDGIGRCLDLLDREPDLGAFFSHDARAPKVLAFLRASFEQLLERRKVVSEELTQLMQHLAHVAAIVSRQQAYARSGATALCDLAALMDDALLLARPGQHKNHIEIVRDYERFAPVVTDKHRVLQILVNLITNALQALSESEREDKMMVARLRGFNREQVELQVEDNGVGIAPEHACRLFRHGFTTRRDGHGFGLHNSALTAKELGGELIAFSHGRGAGAVFTLRLPTAFKPITQASS